jgi:hypothetical protein
MAHLLEVRPHGANSTLGALPANSLREAENLHRIFGGSIVSPSTGIDYTPYTGPLYNRHGREYADAIARAADARRPLSTASIAAQQSAAWQIHGARAAL